MPNSYKLFVLVALSICTLPGAAAVAQDAQEPVTSPESTKVEGEQRLALMREQAERFQVRRQVAGKTEIETLRNNAVFRYADQPRLFADATVWCWGTQGRPVALAKVEMARRTDKVPFWNFCVASLASENIEVEFSNSRLLNTRKPGIEFLPFPEAPEPADREIARQRQMKELAGRFAATINIDAGSDTRQEMRLLPSPVHRYSDDAAGIRDGMIFALTTNGTNPDTLIVIELSGLLDTPVWQYAIVRMTTGEVRIRLNDQEVWTFAAQPLGQTWQHFTRPRTE
jgi:hypothetical protein